MYTTPTKEGIRISDVIFDPQLTLMDSAQVFHWNLDADGNYFACAAGRFVRLIPEENGFILSGAKESEIPFWLHYFDLERSYEEIHAVCSAHPLAARALELLPGMRVLNQPAWETLLTFILSANNNVLRIRQLVHKLTTNWGTNGAFPTPEQLSCIQEADLRSIGCGYRAPYLIQTARMVHDGFPLESLRNQPYEVAHKQLLMLPGVGDKVADCIQLFGLGHSEAFPVDVWVERLMKTWFVPEAGSKKEIRQAAHEMFGKYAGIIQQSLFHCARLGLIPLDHRRTEER